VGRDGVRCLRVVETREESMMERLREALERVAQALGRLLEAVATALDNLALLIERSVRRRTRRLETRRLGDARRMARGEPRFVAATVRRR
jgi:hypothetical protein